MSKRNKSQQRAYVAYQIQVMANRQIEKHGYASEQLVNRLIKLVDSLTSEEQDMFLDYFQPVNVRVRVTNYEDVIKDYEISLRREDVGAEHDKLRKEYADYCVNFYWDDSFICGACYSQEQDERLLDEGKISFEQFMDKWVYRKPQKKGSEV